jgi:hypothetical protein
MKTINLKLFNWARTGTYLVSNSPPGEQRGAFIIFAGWAETGIERMAADETQPAKN